MFLTESIMCRPVATDAACTGARFGVVAALLCNVAIWTAFCTSREA